MRKFNRVHFILAALAALPIAVSPALSSAQTIYSDAFNSAASAANYNVFITQGASGPSSDATFAYDYSALGIPAAPHTTDATTLGLRLRVDNIRSSVGTTVGAVAVATKGLSLPSQYVMSVDLWGNYIGSGTSIAASGANGTSGAAMGIGTSGNSLQYIAANDGFLVDAIHDNGGGANQAYRIYTDATHPNPTTSSYFAAGTGANSATYSDPYYNFLTSQTAPAAQVTLSATQGGSTPVGIIGFAWHTMTISQDGVNVTWAIDGHTIATVPDSALTFGGSQVSLGADDTGLTGSSVALNQTLNADIWDNLTIVETPEPASVALLGLGAVGLFLARRRK